MFINTTTPPTTPIYPITVDQAKDHLRLTVNDFDDLVGVYIATAADISETFINGPLITSTWQYFPDSFLDFPLTIPKGNVQSVASFEFRTADGVWHTISTNSWDFDIQAGRCNVFLKPFVVLVFPVLYSYAPFRITFTAGFGDTSDAVPERVKHACKILVGDLFNQTMTDNKVAEMLLSQYRCWFKEMF